METKARVAVLVDEGHGYGAVVDEMGVGRDTTRTWVRAYRRDGLLWLTGVRKNRSYPFEVKLAAVKGCS